MILTYEEKRKLWSAKSDDIKVFARTKAKCFKLLLAALRAKNEVLK